MGSSNTCSIRDGRLNSKGDIVIFVRSVGKSCNMYWRNPSYEGSSLVLNSIWITFFANLDGLVCGKNWTCDGTVANDLLIGVTFGDGVGNNWWIFGKGPIGEEFGSIGAGGEGVGCRGKSLRRRRYFIWDCSHFIHSLSTHAMSFRSCSAWFFLPQLRRTAFILLLLISINEGLLNTFWRTQSRYCSSVGDPMRGEA